MTKDVLISVSGMQCGPDVAGEKVEVITKGNYYKKKNKHYLLYDEVTEGTWGVTKNLVKFDDKVFQLTKSGVTNVNMLFEENLWQTARSAWTSHRNRKRLFRWIQQ